MIIGEFHETNWRPMSQKYIFNTNNTFKHYYADDTYGTFGRGTYKIKGRRLYLIYDVLPIDSLIFIETKSEPADSVRLDLIIKDGGAATDMKIFVKDSLIYDSYIKSNPISVCLKKPNDKVKIKTGTFFEDIINETFFETEIDFKNYSYCKIEYFPSNSWYKFNTDKVKVLKLKNYKEGCFEIHTRKYKWIYKRE